MLLWANASGCMMNAKMVLMDPCVGFVPLLRLRLCTARKLNTCIEKVPSEIGMQQDRTMHL